MSRTIRSLPTGRHSKKNRVIGYYNHHARRFQPSAIHLLRNPPPFPAPRTLTHFRYGLWLHKPYSYDPRQRYPYYRDEELRQSENSVGGPRWVDANDFYTADVQRLIQKGWTYNHKSERRQTGPEEWDYEYIDLGPAFYKGVVHRLNPDYDEDATESYLEWKNVHQYVVRNGHYKGRCGGRSGFARQMRRSKQEEHQLERSRQNAALLKLVDEALAERAFDLGSDAFPHGVELGEESHRGDDRHMEGLG